MEEEYSVVKIRCSPSCFGVPQIRDRVYYVGLRHEELDPKYAGKSAHVLSLFVGVQARRLQTRSEYDKLDFRSFLQKEKSENEISLGLLCIESQDYSPHSVESWDYSPHFLLYRECGTLIRIVHTAYGICLERVSSPRPNSTKVIFWPFGLE